MPDLKVELEGRRGEGLTGRACGAHQGHAHYQNYNANLDSQSIPVITHKTIAYTFARIAVTPAGPAPPAESCLLEERICSSFKPMNIYTGLLHLRPKAS
jgi:hypothetical protein